MRTYTRTLFYDDLTEAEVDLYITDKTKYDSSIDDEKKIRLSGVKSWTIVEDDDEARALEMFLSDDNIDEYHEYLIITFVDNTTTIYRNSHVTMFIY